MMAEVEATMTGLPGVQFKTCLERELAAACANEECFVADFSRADFNTIVGGWQDKLARVADGEQCWGLFRASKPDTAACMPVV